MACSQVLTIPDTQNTIDSSGSITIFPLVQGTVQLLYDALHFTNAGIVNTFQCAIFANGNIELR